MAKKTRTKEEIFMLALFDAVKALGDDDGEIDFIDLGKSINMNEKSVRGIAKGLLQANFIKKRSETQIILTSQGRRLIQTLLES